MRPPSSPWNIASRVMGPRRAIEDRVLIQPVRGGVVLAVADGVGGRAGGGEAADLAMRSLLDLSQQYNLPIWDTHEWLACFGTLDGMLVDEELAGETTLVAACVTPGEVTGASVGDSGAWLISGDRVLDLTEFQRPKPFLGVGAAFPVAFHKPFTHGTLLVATDGLFKYASPEQIAEAARAEDLEAAADGLVELVRLRSGSLPDDIGLILCRPNVGR